MSFSNAAVMLMARRNARLSAGGGGGDVGFSLPALMPLSLPSSVRGVWDATAVTDISGMSSLPDTSGNGFDLDFGAAKPVVGTDATNGNNYLQFTENVTDRMSAADFFNGDHTSTDDYAMIVVSEPLVNNSGSIAQSGLIGTSNNNRNLRLSSDGYLFVGSGNLLSYSDSAVVYASRSLSLASHVGTSKTASHITDFNNYGNHYLSNGSKTNTDAVANTSDPSGAIYLNYAKHGIRIYGAMYLANPTETDIDDAVAYAMRYWLAGTREKIIIETGDSLTEVLETLPDRSPGWLELSGSALDQSEVIVQNVANGGRRAYELNDNAGVKEAMDELVELWARALPSRVYCPILIGTNDFVDGKTVTEVVDSITEWSNRISGLGGRPHWLQCCYDHKGSPSDRTDVANQLVAISDANTEGFSARSPAVIAAVDTMRGNAVFGIGSDSAADNPELMVDNTHPNTAGNAYIHANMTGAVFAAIAGET